MNKYIYVGKLVNTHGLKGEVRIVSDFKYKSSIFIPGFHLYIGHDKIPMVISTYRPHKNFDMVTFDGINTIDEVLKYKGERVYINRGDLLVDYYDEDLIGLEVYDNLNYVGLVTSIIKNNGHDIIVVNSAEKEYLIPNVAEFIKEVDINNKKIIINSIKGLLNEN